MRVCGWDGVGFHTMFLLNLVSVFFHLAALCTFVRVVRPPGAVLRICNILVCHTIVSPWSVAAPYLLPFFFWVMYLAVLGAYGDGMGWGMGTYGCGSCLCAYFMTRVVVRRSFLHAALCFGALLHNILGFLIYARVAGEM